MVNALPKLFKLAYVNKIRQIFASVPVSINDFDKRDSPGKSVEEIY